MKVTIIGGDGRVGSWAAFAPQCGGLVAELQLLDANKDLAEGEALDLLHGSAFCADQRRPNPGKGLAITLVERTGAVLLVF